MEDVHKRPLGEILVGKRVITQAQLEAALEEQKRTRVRLGEALIALGYTTEEQITEAIAVQLRVSYINLDEYRPEPELMRLISESIARTYKLVPVKKLRDKLTLAMANPQDVEAIDLIQRELKCRVEPMQATEWRIIEVIDRCYGQTEDDFKDFMQQADIDFAPDNISDTSSEDLSEVERQSRFAPIIRMVNYFITDAARRKASDIHIEPRRNTVDIRYRIDGDLRLVRILPRSVHAPITSRVKVMADMDIAERRLPQDGRITVRIDSSSIDVRVSSNPTLYGERIVMRLLDRSQGLIPLERLGFSARDFKIFNALVAQPHGIILVTGPTGSGKTTTLYAALNMLKSDRINIMTVEEPIEYELEGINQTNVRAKIGLTFANQLRTILRQDPDVILVGEIRDTDTADIAFRAALTGHLVLSTLHCNDAPGAITRLIDMEVEPFLISSAIIGIQAQRLVRVLCPECKEAYKPDDRTKILLGLDLERNITLYKAKGCLACDNTGYKGRTTIIEMMPINEEISRLTFRKASVAEIRNEAIRAGMITMRQDAAAKVVAGITTVDEVQRKIFLEADLYNADIHSDSNDLKAA